ncbi:hypothetical protein Zmor_002400 [Zophobas morio]|uniref:Odorant receptor n=1 Tax=Zophobas morio TaxID=2755281 RepID=A0AA38JA67_9CUCU|nr:hypothetical protein Zmor_002400 [Zophobas morio]
MEGIITQCFNRNLFILKIMGLYPTSENRSLHRIFGYIIYTLAMWPQFVLTLVRLSRDGIEDYSFISAAIAFVTIKLLYLLINCDDLATCINYFDRKFERGWNVRQREIVDMYVTKCRSFCTVFFFGIALGLFGWVVTVRLQSYCTKFPLDIWSPSTCESQPGLYFYLYAICIIAVFYASIACAAIDTVASGLLYLVVGQIEVLKESLENLDINVKEEIINRSENGSNIKNTYTYIVRCILHYNDIRNFTQTYENCFSGLLFTQFSEGIMTIGLCCLEIIKACIFLVLYVFLNNLFCILLFQVYFFCYFGTLLVEEHNTVPRAIYMSKWYECTKDCKKLLLVLMECSKKPLVLNAGKIVELSLETFTAILKSSYSVICVLRSN